MSDRHDNAPPEISDSISIMSSNFGETAITEAYPDIWVGAYIDDGSEEELLRAMLDTGTQNDLISAHVVANRWGMDRMDSTKAGLINDLGMNGTPTMGQIRIKIRLAPGAKLIEVPFQVVSSAVVRNRFDALLSARIIIRRDILPLNPLYTPKKEE